MEPGEDRWLLVLDDPVMGLAPWIAFGLLPYVTTFMTLLPGDVVLTGTPEGVGRLSPGDVVEVEVEGVGPLTNVVVGA